MAKQVQFIDTTPSELIMELKAALIPELREQLSQDFQPKLPTEYLTRKDVCNLLQIDLSTLHRWRKDGYISSYGFGNRIYFKRSEIDCLINKNQLR
jgi:excisionase family DNA binding protein